MADAATRRATSFAAAAAVAVLAVPAAGCGGSSSPGVASIGTSANASANKPSWAATYHCFAARSYPKYRIINSPSVPSAPPISGWYKLLNGNFAVTPAFQKLYSGAKFEAAEKACMPLVPYNPPPPGVVAARVAQARNFARCARAHGMANIPDPGSDGSSNPWLIDLKAAGINYDGPKFKDVLATCQSPLKDGALPFIVGNGD